MVRDFTATQSELKCTVPLLNPKEKLTLTVTTIGDPDLSPPEVEARALGVTATPKRDDSVPAYLSMAATAAAIGATAAMGVLLWSSYQQTRLRQSIAELSRSTPSTLEQMRQAEAARKKQEEELERERKEQSEGRPDSQQVVFAILNRAGLSFLMTQLVEKGQGATYWATGLFLVHSFLLDQANGQRYLTALEELIKTPMAASSLGFNLYLLAKVEDFRGNRTKAADYLERCRKETPLMYEHLMQQDSHYDLRVLQRDLQKGRK